MSATPIDILIRARDEATAVIDRVNNAGKSTGTQMQSVGQRMERVGGTMTRTLTPAAIAMGLAFRSADQQFGDGVEKLRQGTGAIGKDLEGLTQSFKNVGVKTNAPLLTVAETMSQIKQRTGATGPELEAMTLQMLRLARISGGDASASVANLTRMFGDWSIKTKDQSASLDELYRLSQISGIAVNDLSGLMVQFGSPLRMLGLDFRTTAAMFSRFEKEGVNIQTVMPGLKMALKNFASAGKDPEKALMATFEAIKTASSGAKANTIAFDTFGARAGPDLAAAIREGRFEFDDYIDTMKNGEDTIAKADADSSGLNETFGRLRNRLFTIIGPFGELGAAVMGGVASMGPMVLGLSQLAKVQWIATASTKALGFAQAALPWIAIAAAVVLVAVIIFKNWDKIKAFLLAVWGWIKDVGSTIWDALKAATGNVLGFLTRMWAKWLDFWFNVAGAILDGAVKAFGWIPGIGDKIKSFRDGFNRVTDSIISDLEKQAGEFERWGSKARSQIDYTRQQWENLRASAQQRLNLGLGGWTGGSSGGGARPPGAQSGGVVSRTGLALIHRGEVFSGVGHDFGPFGRKRLAVAVSIDRRRWVEANDFETTYRGY